jgi:hypothetical protein
MSETMIIPGINPEGGFFDYLESMDDATLDALSELLDHQAHRTGMPVLVLPREPLTLH